MNHRLHRLKPQITQIKARILANHQVSEECFKLVLNAAQMARIAQPGQFLQIKVSPGDEPLLRRPFSIHRRDDAQITLLYEIVGRSTEILSQKKSDEYLDVLGPLGKGFNYQLPITNYQLPILVAGGMGVAPLLFLAEKLAYSVERIAYRKDKGFGLSAKRYPLNAIVLIGAKTKSQILCEKEFRDLGCQVKISTDDGSRGFKGKVTDLLKNLLSAKRYPLNATLYACGPRPMLKEISRISKEHNISAQVSLEEHLACGIGVCLGCVVKTKEGYKRVCKEGPVFNANEIIW